MTKMQALRSTQEIDELIRAGIFPGGDGDARGRDFFSRDGLPWVCIESRCMNRMFWAQAGEYVPGFAVSDVDAWVVIHVNSSHILPSPQKLLPGKQGAAPNGSDLTAWCESIHIPKTEAVQPEGDRGQSSVARLLDRLLAMWG